MTQRENHHIWLFAEYHAGRLLPVYYEMLTKAKTLAADIPGCRVGAILLGSALESLRHVLEESGADDIYYVDDARLATYFYDSYAAVLKALVDTYKPATFLFGTTPLGSELAASLAARLKTGLAAHCVEIEANETGDMTFVVPAFNGKVVGEIRIPAHRPQMASVRPGIFGRETMQKSDKLRSIAIQCPPLPPPCMELISFIPEQPDAQSPENAELVLCCGRGVRTHEAYAQLIQLAQKLQGTIGYTRPAIDMGRAPDERSMIGASGIAVRPKVYLGFGISGATQHVCGITKSGMIISVNHDPNAKIFDYSDYRVVADSAEVLKAMLDALG